MFKEIQAEGNTNDDDSAVSFCDNAAVWSESVILCR